MTNIQIEYTSGTRKYTPDHVITERPDGSAKTKPLMIGRYDVFLTFDRQTQLLINGQHPELDIRFLFTDPDRTTSTQSEITYAKWCDKYGFKYSKGRSIPTEWLEE